MRLIIITLIVTLITRNSVGQTGAATERIIGFKTISDYYYIDNPIFAADSGLLFYSENMSNFSSPFLNELSFPIDSIKNYGPKWYLNYDNLQQNNNIDLIVNRFNLFQSYFGTISFDSCIHYYFHDNSWTRSISEIQNFENHKIKEQAILNCPVANCEPWESDLYLYNNQNLISDHIFYSNYYDGVAHWINEQQFTYDEHKRLIQSDLQSTTLNENLDSTTNSSAYYFKYDNFNNLKSRKFLGNAVNFNWMDSMVYDQNKIKTYFKNVQSENGNWKLVNKKEFNYNTHGVCRIVETDISNLSPYEAERHGIWDTTVINFYYNNLGQYDSITCTSTDIDGIYHNNFVYENGLLTFYEFEDNKYKENNEKVDFDYDDTNFLIEEVHYIQEYESYWEDYMIYGFYTSRSKTEKGNIKTYKRGNLAGMGAYTFEEINDITNEIQGREDFYEGIFYYQDFIPVHTSTPEPIIAINVSPNPCNETFLVNITNIDSLSNLQLNVYNAGGQLMYTSISDIFPTTTTTINCKAWAPGIYIVKATDNLHATFEKLIVN